MVEGEPMVTGNACPRGVTYAQLEMTSPKRMVTTTVALKGGKINRLPVKTDRPIDKEKIKPLCMFLRTCSFSAPINCGDVLLLELLGTDVNLVATRSV